MTAAGAMWGRAALPGSEDLKYLLRHPKNTTSSWGQANGTSSSLPADSLAFLGMGAKGKAAKVATAGEQQHKPALEYFLFLVNDEKC